LRDTCEAIRSVQNIAPTLDAEVSKSDSVVTRRLGRNLD